MKFGDIVRKAFDKRTKGDYHDWVEFNKTEVEEIFKEMKLFIHKMNKIIYT